MLSTCLTYCSSYSWIYPYYYHIFELSFKKLLSILFKTHDPTTLNQQGADIGSQYRSGIFYTNEEQKEIAKKFINDLEKKRIFKNPIITEVTQLENFYEAEQYHQDYFKNNPDASYCKIIIQPKLDKFLKNNY